MQNKHRVKKRKIGVKEHFHLTLYVNSFKKCFLDQKTFLKRQNIIRFVKSHVYIVSLVLPVPVLWLLTSNFFNRALLLKSLPAQKQSFSWKTKCLYQL